MRLEVLADIHSNHHAFKACMDWIADELGLGRTV